MIQMNCYSGVKIIQSYAICILQKIND